MSMWGFARNATKSYLTRLNARAAMDVVKKSAVMGRAGYNVGTMAGGRMVGARLGIETGARELYKGMRQWAWTSPRTALTRGIRIGTAAGAVGGGAMMIGAGRAGQTETERRYGIRPGFSILGRETGERIRRDAGLE
jgi:hypothetical protein